MLVKFLQLSSSSAIMPPSKKRSRSVPKSGLAESLRSKRRKTQGKFSREEGEIVVPDTQSALLLHAVRQPYKTTTDHEVPAIKDSSELLVKVQSAGLNPIDWKAP
jgi:hypothetical protein